MSSRSCSGLCACLVAMLFGVITHSQSARDPYDHAAWWRALSVEARESYIRGVNDGARNAYLVAGEEWLSAKELGANSGRARRVAEKLFISDTQSQLERVVTDLYKDPSNAYVQLLDMVYIARDKVGGKDVTRRLNEARKRALDVHRLQKGQQ